MADPGDLQIQNDYLVSSVSSLTLRRKGPAGYFRGRSFGEVLNPDEDGAASTLFVERSIGEQVPFRISFAE